MSITPCLDRLVSELAKLPGIGEKSAQRLSYFIIKSGANFSSSLIDALSDVENIKMCKVCFSYTEESKLCKICSDSSRIDGVLCVVKNPSDIVKIESSGVFKGKYHVLQGVLDTSNMNDDSIRIKELLDRIRSESVSEIILALDTDFAGDMTSAYIAKLLAKDSSKIKITRIARGIPFGADIEYIDQRTLSGALENRTLL